MPLLNYDPDESVLSEDREISLAPPTPRESGEDYVDLVYDHQKQHFRRRCRYLFLLVLFISVVIGGSFLIKYGVDKSRRNNREASTSAAQVDDSLAAESDRSSSSSSSRSSKKSSGSRSGSSSDSSSDSLSNRTEEIDGDVTTLTVDPFNITNLPEFWEEYLLGQNMDFFSRIMFDCPENFTSFSPFPSLAPTGAPAEDTRAVSASTSSSSSTSSSTESSSDESFSHSHSHSHSITGADSSNDSFSHSHSHSHSISRKRSRFLHSTKSSSSSNSETTTGSTENASNSRSTASSTSKSGSSRASSGEGEEPIDPNSLRVRGFIRFVEDRCTPSQSPSIRPSQFPVTEAPTNSASPTISAVPTTQPTLSALPSTSAAPTSTASPTDLASNTPTEVPSLSPSESPSMSASSAPSLSPSENPSAHPSALPSIGPSDVPTQMPSVQPSAIPSGTPSVGPSESPSNTPSGSPSTSPSGTPSVAPSSAPSAGPSATPSAQPSAGPSTQPSSIPSAQPSSMPSSEPSEMPSAKPSAGPSSAPSSRPSEGPSSRPSVQPTGMPSEEPSSIPTDFRNNFEVAADSDTDVVIAEGATTFIGSGIVFDRIDPNRPDEIKKIVLSGFPSGSTIISQDIDNNAKTTLTRDGGSVTIETGGGVDVLVKLASLSFDPPEGSDEDIILNVTVTTCPEIMNDSFSFPLVITIGAAADLFSGAVQDLTVIENSNENDNANRFNVALNPSADRDGSEFFKVVFTVALENDTFGDPIGEMKPTIDISQDGITFTSDNQNHSLCIMADSVDASDDQFRLVLNNLGFVPKPGLVGDFPEGVNVTFSSFENRSAALLAGPDTGSASFTTTVAVNIVAIASGAPSLFPSVTPTGQPSGIPSELPSPAPSVEPSSSPSGSPSFHPSALPSAHPSGEPSSTPSGSPSSAPSGFPSTVPSLQPSFVPSISPTNFPSADPTGMDHCFNVTGSSTIEEDSTGTVGVEIQIQRAFPENCPDTVFNVTVGNFPVGSTVSFERQGQLVQFNVSSTSAVAAFAGDNESQTIGFLQTLMVTPPPNDADNFMVKVDIFSSPLTDENAFGTFMFPVQVLAVADPPSFDSVPDEIDVMENMPKVNFSSIQVSASSDVDGSENVTMILQVGSSNAVLIGSLSDPLPLPPGSSTTVMLRDDGSGRYSIISTQISSSDQANDIEALLERLEFIPRPGLTGEFAGGLIVTLVSTEKDTGTEVAASGPFAEVSRSIDISIIPEPSDAPSGAPSGFPTSQPSSTPSVSPSQSPSTSPSLIPSKVPSIKPSQEPSQTPSSRPSAVPSYSPSMMPSSAPSLTPSIQPSLLPSLEPSRTPTVFPSGFPSSSPSSIPSLSPSSVPSEGPTSNPSGQPSIQSSSQPSTSPSSLPSLSPIGLPSSIPSSEPSKEPSVSPSKTPSSSPSGNPSATPSLQTSLSPSSSPTFLPSVMPSEVPSASPSAQPSSQPSTTPSQSPSNTPSTEPSADPSMAPSARPHNYRVNALSVCAQEDMMAPLGVAINVEEIDNAAPTELISVTISGFLPNTTLFLPSNDQPLSGNMDTVTISSSTAPFQVRGENTVDTLARLGMLFLLPPFQSDENAELQITLGSAPTDAEFSSSESFFVDLIVKARVDTREISANDPLSVTENSFANDAANSLSLNISISMDNTDFSESSTLVIDFTEAIRLNGGDPVGIIEQRGFLQSGFALTGMNGVFVLTSPSNEPQNLLSIIALTGLGFTPEPGVSGAFDDGITYTLVHSENATGGELDGPQQLNTTVTIDLVITPTPSHQPSIEPSGTPTLLPSRHPSERPSTMPSALPSTGPSETSSGQPSSVPSSEPSLGPSLDPSEVPSGVPSVSPSFGPSETPSSAPSQTLSSRPSDNPSENPSSLPSVYPSSLPSHLPSVMPTTVPSTVPSASPTDTVSAEPSEQPSQSPLPMPFNYVFTITDLNITEDNFTCIGDNIEFTRLSGSAVLTNLVIAGFPSGTEILAPPASLEVVNNSDQQIAVPGSNENEIRTGLNSFKVKPPSNSDGNFNITIFAGTLPMALTNSMEEFTMFVRVQAVADIASLILTTPSITVDRSGSANLTAEYDSSADQDNSEVSFFMLSVAMITPMIGPSMPIGTISPTLGSLSAAFNMNDVIFEDLMNGSYRLTPNISSGSSLANTAINRELVLDIFAGTLGNLMFMPTSSLFQGGDVTFHAGIVIELITEENATGIELAPPESASKRSTVIGEISVRILSRTIVINEIMIRPGPIVQDRNAEWIELFNAGTSDVDINDWTIGEDQRNSTLSSASPLVITPGQYFVLGRSSNMSLNGGVMVDFEYDARNLNSSVGDTVLLLDDMGNVVDVVPYNSDFFSGRTNAPLGASIALRDPTLDNTVGSNWCTSTTAYGSVGNSGTPGAANDCP